MGFGYVIRDGDDEYTENGHIGEHATVFQGEVFAVDRAASKLLELPGREDINIYIDNQATITSLTKPECKMKTTHYCRLKLIELGRIRKVRLRWVKAHAGHELNEKADELAKKGTESNRRFEVCRPKADFQSCLLYTSPSPRDKRQSRMPSSA